MYIRVFSYTYVHLTNPRRPAWNFYIYTHCISTAQIRHVAFPALQRAPHAPAQSVAPVPRATPILTSITIDSFCLLFNFTVRLRPGSGLSHSSPYLRVIHVVRSLNSLQFIYPPRI